MPQRSASARVACEVGTATMSRPARTRSPSKFDKMLRGRSGAEPKPHAGTHEFDGASGGCAFLGVGVHRGLMTFELLRFESRRLSSLDCRGLDSREIAAAAGPCVDAPGAD